MQQQNSTPFVEVIRRDRAAVADCARAAILLETPNGSSNPEATGGNILVYNPVIHGLAVHCRGDRTPQSTVTLDCANTVTPSTSGSVKSVTVSAQEGPIGPVVGSVAVASGDGPQATPGTTPVCAGVFVNGSCVGTMTTVPTATVGGDTSNDTVVVTAASTSKSANVPRTCVGTVAC